MTINWKYIFHSCSFMTSNVIWTSSFKLFWLCTNICRLGSTQCISHLDGLTDAVGTLSWVKPVKVKRHSSPFLVIDLHSIELRTSILCHKFSNFLLFTIVLDVFSICFFKMFNIYKVLISHASVLWQKSSLAQFEQFQARNSVYFLILQTILLDLFKTLHKVEKHCWNVFCFFLWKVLLRVNWAIFGPKIWPFTHTYGTDHCMCLSFCTKGGIDNWVALKNFISEKFYSLGKKKKQHLAHKQLLWIFLQNYTCLSIY